MSAVERFRNDMQSMKVGRVKLIGNGDLMRVVPADEAGPPFTASFTDLMADYMEARGIARLVNMRHAIAELWAAAEFVEHKPRVEPCPICDAVDRLNHLYEDEASPRS